MQYTRPMIDLVYEIRRRVDANMKPSVKLANPDVLTELAEYYKSAKDTIVKTLIKELLSMAGDEWLALLKPNPPAEVAAAPQTPRQTVKVYRGQIMLEESSPQAASTNTKETRSELLLRDIPTHSAPKTQRMYRGQPVD